MAKDPAFLFYSSDFLTGTALFTLEQRGKYITLLCLQHQNGRLSEEDMLYICSTHDKRVFDKFEQDETGMYYNKRLENEKVRREEFSKSRRENRFGKKNKAQYIDNEELIEEKPIKNKKTKKEEVIKMSSTYVASPDAHMETATITVTKEESIGDSDNDGGVQGGEKNGGKREDENFEQFEGNWSFEMPTAACQHFFFEHQNFKQDREKCFEPLKYQLLELPDEEVWDRMKQWAKVFNDRNDLKFPKRPLRGSDSWGQHFLNWLKKQKLSEATPKISKDKKNQFDDDYYK